MHHSLRFIPFLLVPFFSACGGSDTDPVRPDAQTASLRIINAFTAPIDILVDGQVVASALAPGTIDTLVAQSGARAVSFRANGTTSAATVTVATGAFPTVAALRSTSGSLGNAVLDDTNSVVPTGATKLRVLHLAPNTGELQVYHMQPGAPARIRWQFPFTYQSSPTTTSAPFLQSTPGTWEVRVWQSPADVSGWATAPSFAFFTLATGQKGTIVILDKPGGGFRIEGL